MTLPQPLPTWTNPRSAIMGALALMLTLYVASETPAAADLESCIAALEAEDIYREAVAPAQAAFQKARREADELQSEAHRRADQAWGEAHNAQATELRKLNPYGSEAERAEYDIRSAEIKARYAPRFHAADQMWEEADTARDRAWEHARETLETTTAPAKKALVAALTEAYPGPTSDNPKIMDQLLGKFLRECRSVLR